MYPPIVTQKDADNFDRDAQGNIIINRDGKPWVHWKDRPDPSPFDTYEKDKSRV